MSFAKTVANVILFLDKMQSMATTFTNSRHLPQTHLPCLHNISIYGDIFNELLRFFFYLNFWFDSRENEIYGVIQIILNGEWELVKSMSALGWTQTSIYFIMYFVSSRIVHDMCSEVISILSIVPSKNKLAQSTKNKKTDWCEISILICQRCIGFAAYSQQHVQLNHQNFPSHFIRSSMCAHGYLKWNEIHVISDLSAKREKGKKKHDTYFCIQRTSDEFEKFKICV